MVLRRGNNPKVWRLGSVNPMIGSPERGPVLCRCAAVLRGLHAYLICSNDSVARGTSSPQHTC